MIKKVYKIIAIFLIFLFVAHWATMPFFTHNHVIDGYLIVHSHPYSAEHTHTEAELEIIASLSAAFVSAFLPLEIQLPSIFFIAFILLSQEIYCLCETPHINISRLRAPPFLFPFR